PVETVVTEFDTNIVREAIRRELDRGGQVFYVQNRINLLESVVSRLTAMLPQLRIGVVHGRMAEDQVEDVMARFINQEFDVLVATSIIESGLDIPTANTLIVEDADKMGLAQLYQLRGRVGRSFQLGYAYFMYHRDKVLTPAAEKRLEAIREFTELGAGYQIALRDLEIRGAGNLLGAEQHGFIASVGFDLYTQLLRQAIRELQGQAEDVEIEPFLEFAAEAYIPEEYIADASQKIAIYKRLAASRTREDVEDVLDEMVDRFGELPEPVQNLVTLTRIRVMAKVLKMTAVMCRQDRIVLRVLPGQVMESTALVRLAQRYPGRLVSSGKTPELAVRQKAQTTAQENLRFAEDILTTLQEGMHGTRQESG
ncbi:MAG: helicase-related protein, partial [Firmicutes bacterium]|nr:helicase-related protein [Bacillota bacterium]